MKLLTIPCFVALFLLTGCWTTYYLPRDPSADEFVKAICNMQGRTVSVTPIEGNVIRLDSLTSRSDTLVGCDHDSHAVVEIPLSKVGEIDETSISRGILRGIVACIPACVIVEVIASAFVSGLIPSVTADWGDVVRRGVLDGVLFGSLDGALFLSTDHYRFVVEGDSRIEYQGGQTRKENSGLEGLSPSEVITLKSWSLHDETPEAISILWDGKPVWLPRSKIKFVRLAGGKINLAVPKSLLEAPQEK